jgi:hypothetical protein
MDKHLIDFEEFRNLARPTSKHLDEEDVMNAISESEDVYIVPSLGVGVYNLVTKEYTEANPIPDNLKILRDGGYWCIEDGILVFDTTFDATFAIEHQKVRVCHGLKKTVAYFAYTKMVREDGAVVTRSGTVQHNDQYAARMAQNERHARYNDAMNVAEQYLNSCLVYLEQIDGGCCSRKRAFRGHRAHIHAIGK